MAEVLMSFVVDTYTAESQAKTMPKGRNNVHRPPHRVYRLPNSSAEMGDSPFTPAK